MSTRLDYQTQRALPAHWPEALHPDALDALASATPALVCDLATVRDRYERLVACLPGVQPYYALKCNPSAEIVTALAPLGSSFEIASAGELDILLELGIDASEILYSNTVKPPSHVARAYEAGVWRFAFDSVGELHKLAEHAPGSSVFVRLRVDDSTSIFPLSRKFGAEADDAYELLLLAERLGLEPYGVTFHVGSQCTAPNAWRQAIAAVGRLLTRLSANGIDLEMLNVSGGFPARYVEPVPAIETVAETIAGALDELLPYVPPHLAAEPGRYLVAESAVLVASVLGREVRAGENWLYLDVGAYNGLIETHQSANQWLFPLWTSVDTHATTPHEPFTITGPTCDSSDTMFYGASLPASIDVDDRVYVGSAGAYTLSYASSFNGFPPPVPLFVGA